MDTNNQTPSTPGNPGGFAQRMQHSKALIAIVAVLGVTVLALAATLVVKRSDAQPGGTAATAPTSQSSKTSDHAKTNHSNTNTQAVKRPAVVAAQSPKPIVCADCGTVEAVTAVQRQGKVNGVAVGNTTVGVGTVAGGLVGGLLGSQMGGGDGKKVMAVLGVAGGALAGNAIEKNMKKVTIYQVRVRMNDGSIRNMEVSSSVPVGAKVIVEGLNLRLA